MTPEQLKIEKSLQSETGEKTEEEKEWDTSEIPIPEEDVKEYIKGDLEWIKDMREIIVRVIKRDIEKNREMEKEYPEVAEKERQELKELIEIVEMGRDKELGKFLRKKFEEMFK